MNLAFVELLTVGFSLALLVFLSMVEGAVTQSSLLTLRMMQERDGPQVPPLLAIVLEDKTRLLVPLHLGTQLCLLTITILTAHLSFVAWPDWGFSSAFGIVLVISLLFRQLIPRILTQNNPEQKLFSLLQTFGPFYRVLHSLALPLSGILRVFRRLQEDAGASKDSAHEEASEEEIQAYLDIGEDEGILEKEDSQLIQSVVEFGDTLAREVMTPRTKIVACDENATLGELRHIMVNHRHSRIPIYRGDIDHIVGIAYIRQLLAHYAAGKELMPITGLIRPALFVPETKPVSKLLRELQERGDHAAIVIDEFGGVAGLVTIEDLVEEIVGEIRDEDQAKVSEVVEEAPRTYVFRGSTELYRLEDLGGKRFEGADGSTVAGLIEAYLGRVPAPGEEFELKGMHIQILDADRRRVHRVRIFFPAVAAG